MLPLLPSSTSCSAARSRSQFGTCLREGNVIVRIARCSTGAGLNGEPELRFAVVEGRIRASGWDLFAARQLVRENGGDIRVEGQESSGQRVTISFPADLPNSVQESDCAVSGRGDSRKRLRA